MADIFISYTSSDRDWAFWIAKELEGQGHTPHIHEWEIESGGDIYGWMEKSHDAADHVLCVVSDEYLKAPYSTLERNAALWQAATKRPGFVLLVAVKPCRFPTLTDHLRRCELYGVSEQERSARLRGFMAKRGAPGNIVLPGAYAVSNIPIRLPSLFMGREEAFAAIEAALNQSDGRPGVAALHGLRGVGKSTLAAAYAERHRERFRATWWVRAQSEAALRADLVALAVRLGWADADEKEEPALAAAMERLRHEGEGCLLIYDNALDARALRTYLPASGRAQVLLTSNTHAWRGMAVPVAIALWPNEVGADYLIARTGHDTERAAALALSETLGGLPLAHEQAAAYCERLGVALADYAKRFAAAPAKFLDTARDAPAEYHDGLTVAKTFALAIDEAAKLHCAAEPLIVHAALLAPEPIPLYLFEEAREKLGEPFASALADEGVDEAVAALRAFALVDRETIGDEREPSIATPCIRLHRLVRQVALMRPAGGPQEAMRRALVEAVAAVYPRYVWRDPGAWPRVRRLDPLALALVADAPAPSGAEASASEVLISAGQYRQWALAAYGEARPLFERALAIREALHGPDHRDVATCLNNLALLSQARGDFSGARPLFERALAISENKLGPDHAETAVRLNNLAHVLMHLGDHAAAQPLFERALALSERTLGTEHPDTAVQLNNLARLHLARRELSVAKPLFERALAIREQALGADHPDTATSLDDLAALLAEQGDLGLARPLLERALAIREKALGPEHPDTATSLSNLGRLIADQGDLPLARPLFERALAIREKVLGPEHPDTASGLNNLAFLLQDQGEFAGARVLYERALAISEKTLGPEHPDTAVSLNNLAYLLMEHGEHARAQPLFERALGIGEKTLGPEHPNTNRGRRHLAALLLALGHTQEARRLGEAALAAHERTLGPSHPWTRDSATVTADALALLGHNEGAAALRTRYAIADGCSQAGERRGSTSP